MTDAQVQFELVEFEHVEAAPGSALLRVSGRASADIGAGPLALVISVEGDEHRHEQLPALPGTPDLIRAAFSAPLDHVASGATYQLELPSGQLVRLPAPTRRRSALSSLSGHASTSSADAAAGAGPGRQGAAADETGGESGRLIEAERRAESRRLAIVELERRIQSERERRSAAESDLAHLRSERDQARAERDAALAERDEAVADRDQAEARARATAANAGSLEAQIRAGADSAARAQATLEAQLADRTAELERVREAAEAAQARAHATRREVLGLDEQLAHAQAQITVLQQALDEREATSASAQVALEDAASSARAEALSARERVAALEEELGSLRELATRFDAQHTYDAETAQARLEAAQAELESVRTEAEAMRHRNGELEATLAELDAALALRAAEIDLLRGALAGQAGPGAGSSPAAQAELEHLRTQLAELSARARAETERRVRTEEALLESEAQRRLLRA